MSDPKLYFGVDIDAAMQEWWQGYTVGFHREFGEEAAILVQVFDSRQPNLYTVGCAPLVRYDFRTGPFNTHFIGQEGLQENIERKFYAIQRLGERSLIFEERPDLLEPGDFPYDGAGIYRNYPGGASGLPTGALDWRVFADVVDVLIEMRSAAAARAVNASKGDLPGWKYLEDLYGTGGLPPIPAIK
jgi:hypothetical protein